MRVAVITQYFPTSAQPWAGHSAYQTLRELARHCELQVFHPVARYPKWLNPKTSGTPLDLAWSPIDVRATYLPYPVLPLITRPLNGLMIAATLRAAVTRFQPDVLLNYVVYPDGYAAVRLGRKLRVPVVLTAIGSDLNRIPGRLVGVLTRAALRGADAVTTVSHDLCRTAVRLGARPETTQTILNGCDTAIFRPQSRLEARAALGEGLTRETDLVLYVGRLDLRKGLAELVDAAARLSPVRPNLSVCLVGDGPDRTVIERQIARLDLGRTVRLTAPCTTEKVAQWMAAADLVTLPSYMEGCPNVVLEALTAGRPVVATRVGGIPELMDDRSGRLVPPRDPVALAAALEEVLKTQWEAQVIADLHHRSWANVAEDLLNILNAEVTKNKSKSYAGR